MTLKKSSRAGLFALAFGILIGLFLSVATYDASYAQAQAPAAAPAAAPPAPAAPPPACAADPDPKKAVTEKCTPNSGDTAWMLTSVALVLMMTIPGPWLVLWRHGAQEERRRHGDDELCRHVSRHDPLRDHHLQLGLYSRRGHLSAGRAARSCKAS